MESQDFAPKTRLYLAILMAAFGLFCAHCWNLFSPGFNGCHPGSRSAENSRGTNFAMTAKVLPTFFIIMRGINFVAGITLIVTAYFFNQGEKWTWSVALLASALPTIFGVLHNLPHIVQYNRPPAAISILVFGLVTYLLVLLLKPGTKVQKWARFLVFTLLGVTAGHINVLVMHSLKNIITRPDAPYFSDLMYTVYTYEGPVNFIAFVFCILAIPFLASENKKFTGWMLALIAGLSVTLANFPTHFIRMQTSDFFVAGSLGLGSGSLLPDPGVSKSIARGRIVNCTSKLNIPILLMQGGDVLSNRDIHMKSISRTIIILVGLLLAGCISSSCPPETVTYLTPPFPPEDTDQSSNPRLLR